MLAAKSEDTTEGPIDDSEDFVGITVVESDENNKMIGDESEYIPVFESEDTEKLVLVESEYRE